ncbi:hypothetical protein [Aeoliella sp. SH292]|uniref:hypothetical protein n=1 Tax=Aeoliella sp. SH292 TaxID=3454464 RepID=UPI003F9D4492
MEDWGWASLIKLQNRPFLLGFGGYEVDGEDVWLIFVQSQLPFYKRWIGTRDDSELAALCVAIHKVLASNTEVSDIRWYRDDDFFKGKEGDWTATPDG